jgi:hypothetical protein
MANTVIPHKKQPKWKKVNSSSELNKLKSKLKTIDINNKEQRTQIQRQIQVLVDQQRQFKQEKENKEIRRILKKAKIDQTRHVISKLKKLQADPSTDPTLVKDSERNLLELKALSIEDLLQAWPSRATLDATDVKHAVLFRASKLHDKKSAHSDTEEKSEEPRSGDENGQAKSNKKGPQRVESYFMHSLGGEKDGNTNQESFFTGSLGNDSDSEPIEQVEVTKKKNRPGQRTRRRMAEEMRLKGALGPAPTSHKRSFSELDTDVDQPSVKRRKIQHEEADTKRHNHKAGTSAESEQLHPSWSAIKKAKESQRVVLGNAKEHVVFDSDEE